MRDFDAVAMYDALDARRGEQGLSWAGVARAIWEQSSVLNSQRDDHPISPTTITGIPRRGNITCQHALFMLRWLDQIPEDFLSGGGDIPWAAPLPACGADRRLRWSLKRLHAGIDDQRRSRGLTWGAAAGELHCQPSQLTGLRTARFATGMRLAMRTAQWMQRPAADFIYVAGW